jgi:hypothetical protein
MFPEFRTGTWKLVILAIVKIAIITILIKNNAWITKINKGV